MKRGHSVRLCKIRKYFVPKGIMRWIPKDSGVPSDECKSKGDQHLKGDQIFVLEILLCRENWWKA